MNRPADAASLGAELLEAAWDDAETLNSAAWLIVHNEKVRERDLDFAIKAATRAVELTESKDSAILDTLARIHFEQGYLAAAVEWQAMAVAASDGDIREKLDATLKRYQNASASGGRSADPPPFLR
ncbi:MAG: hypothetical protein NTW21_36475 [Verrucomicrobia bacterium]|nr:hypothetical protein [Verrucomicrobiota bacterium]